MKTFLQKNSFYILLGIIFLTAFFLRFYRLAELPDIIHVDEAGLGYNAWCIAHYGVDRYLNELPFYAQNFNGGQSPLYTYLAVLLIKTVGMGNLSLLLIRLPGLISSMVVVVVGTKTVAYIFQNRKITLMSALLLTICPYFIMHGRFALDCNLMLGCSTVSLCLLVKYIRSGKPSVLLLSGVAFGITLYSYALSYFVLPLFLIFITLYLLYTGKITFRRALLWAVCVCLTALPVILFACSLLFQWEPFKFLWFTISPVASSRMSDVASTNFFENIIDIAKITVTNSTYPLDAVPKFYTMYPISIPFIIIGFLSCGKHFFYFFKKRTFHFDTVYLLFYICGLITIGLTGTHYVYRANYFFISYLYFLVCGIYAVYGFLRSYRHFFIGALSLGYLVWGLAFSRYYFQIYSMAEYYTYPNSLYGLSAKNLISYAQEELDVKDIYIDYITMKEYFLFDFPISPYEKEAQRHEDGFGRYHFEVNYYTPIDTRNAYIVHKDNREFLSQLNFLGTPYETIESPYYYLFYFQ